MKPHKWAKEIKAWADGAEIEYFDDGLGEWRDCTSHAIWDEDDKYRIKPKHKEPQYLLAWEDANGLHLTSENSYPITSMTFLGKIKLEIGE